MATEANVKTELAPGERHLLEWLSKEEWSSYGECCGKDFDRLYSVGLIERRRSNRSHIDAGYDLCRLTAGGWAKLADQHD